MRNFLATFMLIGLVMFSNGAWAQSIDGVPIGSTLPSTGKFTNLEATTQITLGAETITNFSGIDDDKVKVSSGDTPGFLESKIVAGTGVTVTTSANEITISAPPVNVEDSADGVEITFAGESQSALDLNGTALFIGGTDPTVTLGGQAMWVMGGTDNANKNDVWYSTDGVTWAEATSNADWSARVEHTSLVYDNKMWVIGGIADGIGFVNDVWYSTDGINWTQATANAAWSARRLLTSLVYDNKIWIMGGNETGTFNDVWYSSDGSTWTEATSNADWSARSQHTAVVYDNKMWVIGGHDGTNDLSDVWNSTDGITWTQATANAAWPTRRDHASVVYDNKIWVIAGAGSSNKNDVWQTAPTP